MNFIIGKIISYGILLHTILKINSAVFDDCRVEYDQDMSGGPNEYNA